MELTSPQVRALSAPTATPARAAVANGPLGEHDQARTLTEYILSRRRRILGDDHPDTLRTAAALTEILRRSARPRSRTGVDSRRYPSDQMPEVVRQLGRALKPRPSTTVEGE